MDKIAEEILKLYIKDATTAFCIATGVVISFAEQYIKTGC